MGCCISKERKQAAAAAARAASNHADVCGFIQHLQAIKEGEARRVAVGAAFREEAERHNLRVEETKQRIAATAAAATAATEAAAEADAAGAARESN